MDLETVKTVVGIAAGGAAVIGGAVKGCQWVWSRSNSRQLSALTERQRGILGHFDQLWNVAGATPTGGYQTIYWGNPARPDNAANITATMNELRSLGLLALENGHWALTKRGRRLKALIQ